eukprot:3520091-Rhodomonas_salina.1
MHERGDGRNHLPGSPFSPTIRAGRPTASQSIARGAGITLATAGTASSFTIFVRDNPASSDSPESWPIRAFLEKEGFYREVDLGTRRQIGVPAASFETAVAVSYTLTASGQFQLSVQSAGFNICGSPFSLICFSDHRYQDIDFARRALSTRSTTAGVPYTFTVNIKDGFGNDPSQQSVYRVIARPETARDETGSVSLLADGTTIATVTTTRSAEYSVFIASERGPGLSATYYDDVVLLSHVSAGIFSSIDFSLAAGEVPAASLTPSSSYSIRWSGF